MNEKSIYDLKLNEQIKIDSNLSILRVPGGWIYEYARQTANITGRANVEKSLAVSCVFVPYNEEFNNKDSAYETRGVVIP